MDNRRTAAVNLSTSDLEGLRSASEAIRVAAGEMAKALAPALVAFAHAGRRFYASLWYHYVLAGAPYGESYKGLTRWIKESATRDK